MSAKSEIEQYLASNKDEWHFSAQLTRMTFQNDDKTNADPKAISNRLQELQRESVIFVRYEGKKRTSKYRWIPPDWRERYIPSHTHGVDGAWQGKKQSREQMLRENAAQVAKFDREWEKEHNTAK